MLSNNSSNCSEYLNPALAHLCKLHWPWNGMAEMLRIPEKILLWFGGL